MQIRAISCVVIMNLIIQGEKIIKVIREKTVFKFVIEFTALKSSKPDFLRSGSEWALYFAR